ncbi:MAG: UDP-glucose 4-epimerase GalE [Pyrinomonadaceae bacterium]
MQIMVAGGAGYIGSVVTDELVSNGHSVTVYDNLQKGHRDAVTPDAEFVEGALHDSETLKKVFRDNRIEAVIHLAASSLVGESVADPAKYYQNNVAAGISLLDAMLVADVKRIVFSSTAAVYGDAQNRAIVETDPLDPTNPYGETKLVFENMLRWYDRAYDLKYTSLRYFNAAGATEKRGERHEPETHLIPLVLQAALGKIPTLSVFGDDYQTRDGTCIRDYIHVVDLAKAHILALQNLSETSAVYNLGCGGSGYSVREVIDTTAEVTGLEIPFEVVKRRAGDPAILIASSDLIRKELGWQPEFQDLQVIIESAWKWLRNDIQDSAGAAR